MDMISLHDIQKSYGSNQVLKNVDLTVRQGEIYGLIEKNGAGKTTIFKAIPHKEPPLYLCCVALRLFSV